MTAWTRLLRAALAGLVLAAILAPQTCGGYSVLTHQELIDLAWADSIRPLLLERFPGTTDAELRVARAYAYGGCAIQDMGYYPFGEHFFSDLMHYVRTGDFVSALLHEASNVNEYAFAIGALSHYLGDDIGHSRAVNPAVAIAFPELRRKYGRIVTYDESPHSHIRTEFAFDIGQLAKETFAPPGYLRAIGLRVPPRLLQRAFLETYGLRMRELVGHTHPALRSYGKAVRSFIPAISGAEVVLHRNDFPPETANDAYLQFRERLQRAAQERKWERPYDRPRFGSHLLALLIRIVPKWGALSDVAIKVPKPTTEDWYIRSVNHTVDRFQAILGRLRSDPALILENRDLDTGRPVHPGTYPLMDETYEKLVERLTAVPARTIPVALRHDILDYYSNPAAPIVTKKNKKKWKKLNQRLEVLRQMNTAVRPAEPAASD